eukprot:14014768-Ditylum_brightwellii.AAC.1
MSTFETKDKKELEGGQLVSEEEGEDFYPPTEFEDPDISNIEWGEKDEETVIIEDLPVAEEEVVVENPPAPRFPLSMTTPAEQFLGADRLSALRNIADVHAIDVIVKKTERATVLDAKALHKFRENAESSLSTKFNIFRTKAVTPELENVYNVSLLIKDLKYKVQKYDLDDIFKIFTTDPIMGAATNAPLVNLFDHYKTLALKQLKEHCKYANKYLSPYFVQHNQWTHRLILSSSKADLETCLKNKLLTIDELSHGGPVVFKLMVDIIFLVTDQALRSLVSHVKNMKVTENAAKNVSRVTGFICGVYTICLLYTSPSPRDPKTS